MQLKTAENFACLTTYGEFTSVTSSKILEVMGSNYRYLTLSTEIVVLPNCTFDKFNQFTFVTVTFLKNTEFSEPMYAVGGEARTGKVRIGIKHFTFSVNVFL